MRANTDPPSAGAPDKPITMKYCVDPSLAARLNPTLLQNSTPGCGKSEFKQTAANLWRFDAFCEMEGLAKMTVTGTLSGDFQTQYAMRVHTVITNRDDHGPKVQDMALDARYLGACPAGVKPGDVVMADGSTVSVN